MHRARLAVEPDVILMDEPCSALDPIATAQIEDLMHDLKDDYTIVIVTHNMQQAARVSDMTAFLMPEVRDGDVTIGHLVEFAETDKIFTNPDEQAHRGLRHREVGLDRGRSKGRFHDAVARAGAGGALHDRPRRARRSTSAVEAALHHDTELAVMVIEGDDRIDGRYLDVHQGILSLLARQSPGRQRPAARGGAAPHDMHIERLGDLAVNIAKLVPLMGEPPAGAGEIMAKVEAAGNQARDQLKQAQIAFEQRNVNLAENLVARTT